MKPYYQDSAVTIYHGDCLEALPQLPGVDLALTDPPYGIGAGREKPHNGWIDHGISNWDLKRPNPEIFNLMTIKSISQIVWGGNYYTDILPPTMCWLIWDKGQRDFSLADGEMAWTSFKNAMRIKTISRAKALQDGKQHPTQKPLDIMAWCISVADRNGKAQTIIDPFMGSGTTLRAAKDLNRKAIGIEIEEKYCEIAANRMCQEVLDL